MSFQRFRVEKWRNVRVSIIMEGSTGSLTVDAAGLYGNLDSHFDSGTPVDLPSTPTTLTADGQSFGQGYTAIDTDYQMLEVGVNAYNHSGSTKREMALVTLVVDFET